MLEQKRLKHDNKGESVNFTTSTFWTREKNLRRRIINGKYQSPTHEK